MANKRFFIATVSIFLVLICIMGGLTVFVDPLFHYHSPVDGISYPLSNQRYQNYGIVKQFDYNALITGTSMTENFKTSDWEAAFGGQAIKVPFSGSYLKETSACIQTALESNPQLKYVVRSLDL